MLLAMALTVTQSVVVPVAAEELTADVEQEVEMSQDDADAEAAGRGAGLYPHSVPEIGFADARYCRRIPALTETAARQGDSSARVCGDNQKRYTPGFTALTERGVVPS